MSNTQVLFEQQGPVARITFSTPGEGVNILSTAMIVQLENILDDIRRRPEIRVIVFTGHGRTFLAGADIAEMSSAPGDVGKSFSRCGQRCMMKLARFEQAVTIAAINGPALGTGCEVALACDMRVMANEASIGFPEVKFGLIPGWGGTQRAFALMGPSKARRMLFVAEPLAGLGAAETELVNLAVPSAELDEAVERLVQKVLSNGPSAVRLAKRVICATEAAWLEKGMMLESEAFGEAFISEEAREGLRAFLQKRPPSWAADAATPVI